MEMSAVLPDQGIIATRLARDASIEGSRRGQIAVKRPHRFIIWGVVIAIFMPSTMALFIAGAKLTPGRIPLLLLFIPAMVSLAIEISKHQRRWVPADLLMLAGSTWMIGAPLVTSGPDTLISSGAEALELVGAYIVARAYFFDRIALQTFIRVLKLASCVLIGLAMFDTFSGRDIVYETTARLFGAPYFEPRDMERLGVFRAKSTFDHAILFGTFCSVTAALFLYSESSFVRRTLFCGFCFLGIALSISSGPLMGFFIAMGSFTYDRIMQNYSWRWKLLWVIIGAFIGGLFLVSNSPIGWLITHLTFDEQNGYFRLATWYAAFDQISLSPLTGQFRQATGNEFLDTTVDTVWLVSALQYGVPFASFLLLANLSAIIRLGSQTRIRRVDPYMNRMRTGLSLMLTVFMFVGLTVHFWSTMWMFWGLCIGIRASLNESIRKVAKHDRSS